MVYILKQTNTETNTDGKTHISQCQVVLQLQNKLFFGSKHGLKEKFEILRKCMCIERGVKRTKNYSWSR